MNKSVILFTISKKEDMNPDIFSQRHIGPNTTQVNEITDLFMFFFVNKLKFLTDF